MPDGTYLDSLQLNSNTIKVSGYSESNNLISSLMRNLDSSHKYVNSNLTKVQHDSRLGEQGSVFDLQVDIETPAAVVEENTAP